MKKLYKNDQTGRSMVEMLGVLAIIGVLSVGGIAGYSKAMGKFKITKMNDQITMLVANIRTAYANQPDYTGLDLANAITLNLIPADMIGASNTASNAYGGALTLSTVASTAGQANGAFSVSFPGLPKDACISVATSDWGSTSSGLQSITIEGDNETANMPMSPTEASTACDNAAGNTVVWTYF